MEASELLVRTTLAAVFIVAALAKLTDREGSGQAIRELGVPGSLASVLAVVLPVVELVTAAALLAASPTLAGLLALGLLGIFTVAIAVILARGKVPRVPLLRAAPCRPGGAVDPGAQRRPDRGRGLRPRLGGRGPEPGGVGGRPEHRPAPDPGGCGRFGGSAGTARLVRAAPGGAERADAAPPRGAGRAGCRGAGHHRPRWSDRRPPPSPPDLAGQTHTLESLLEPGHPLLLVFSDPDCHSCGDLVPELGRWQSDHSERLRVALVSLFLFNRDKYVRWDLDSNSIDPGYPRVLTEGWPGVTFDRVDAVVNVSPDALYFFSGGQYIRFDTLINHADAGYPDVVASRWLGVTFDRIDAATYWGNGKAYFFCGNQYIRYDTVMSRADAGYPKVVVSHYFEDWKFFE